jgi:UDP-N-acetyl-D-mannosaminuronic acid dehydrogenase
MKANNKQICVLGLGYVGLTLSATLATSGFKVVGVEIRKKILDDLQKKKPHFYEPNLKKILTKVIKNKSFQFYNSIPNNWSGDTFIITVGTPLDKNGKSRLDLIKNVSNEVGQFIKKKDLVILRSTVKVGTSRNTVKKIIEKKEPHFDLAFCPERTQEGKALTEVKKIPQIIGGLNHSSSNRAKKIFKKITKTNLIVSSLETAELIKLVDNSQRDVYFSYANEIAKICDDLKINASEVINTGKFQYARTNLAMPGPVGGPCLIKDTYILSESLNKKQTKPKIALAARKINENLPKDIISQIKSELEKRYKKITKVSFLGFAFKGNPPTDDTRDSMSIQFYREAVKKFPSSHISIYDKLVKDEDYEAFNFNKSDNLNLSFKDANVVIILNNHKVFQNLNLKKMSNLMKNNALIYDCWNLFDKKRLNLNKKVKYSSFGNI